MPRNRLTRDPSGIRSSEPFVPPVELLLPPTVPTGLSFFLLLFSFFVTIASFPIRNFAPGSPRNDDRQLDRPTTSPVFLMRISLSQSRSLPASDRLQGILPFSDLRCIAFPAVPSFPPPPTTGGSSRVGTGLLIQTSQR